MPNLKPSIPYPSRRDNEKRRDQANEQIEKFYEIFKDMSFEISFTDALILMPKFDSTLKALIGNKEKLSEMARTTMNEHCSAVILNKLPRKLDLGAGINLMPLSVWEGLSHLELTPTCMTLELTDRSVSKPIGIAKDVSFKVGVFHFPADFVGINPEFCTHKILMEEDYKPVVQHQRRVNPKIHDVIKKEFKKLLDAGLIYPISDSPWVSPVHCVPKKGGFTVVENKENELILTRLVTEWRYYCFLDGFSGYFQIPIDPRDQEKTTFTCPYGTFAHRRMPFGLCNALGTFQRCMLAIFHDMVEKTMEVFMDDFSVFGNSFENCLSRLDKMLQRIEVDKAKIDVIDKLPHPTTVKGVRSFLGHVGFYRRFIQDFSKLSRPMTHLLEKNTPFIFSEDYIKAFQTLKKKLTEAPILIAPNWDLPFELMCDASDFTIGAVLRQRHEKHFRPIHYASKTWNDVETNYTTTKKEMLAV
nr:reverse transcriptase domain-containing protein [Tanacetum cinerariifolium]